MTNLRLTKYQTVPSGYSHYKSPYTRYYFISVQGQVYYMRALLSQSTSRQPMPQRHSPL